MHSNHRETEQEFADKIAIAYRVETVLADASKTQLAGHQFAIQNDGGTGERAGAEGKNVRSFQTIAHTFDVASEDFDLA